MATVRATKAAVEGEQVWNSRTLRWLAVILTLILACGLVTYYYHLYEPEEDDEEQTVTEGSGPQIRPLDAYWARLHAEKGLLIRK